MKIELSGLYALIALGAFAMTVPAFAGPSSRNGTTLAASKTIDICSVDEWTWRYSGLVSVWNQGAVNTEGFAIEDCIQNKAGSGQFQDTSFCTDSDFDFDPPLHEITKGTTELPASTFAYSFEGAPLEGDLRNIARVTITNHSGSLGTAKGPEPKATWTGEVLACADDNGGCGYSQGFWKTHHEAWPDPYDPGDGFYLSGETWGQVLIPHSGGNKYYLLSIQYVAAVLNAANGASVPDGVQDILDLAENFFDVTAPSACSTPNSCGTQNTWASILEDYNTGDYPDGPEHCSDE